MNPYSQIISDPYHLLEELDKNNEVKIVGRYVQLPDYSGLLYDVSLKVSGPQEDEHFAQNEFYRQNLRRGNSFLQKTDKNGNVDKTMVVRKGLRKFFDLSREYIEYNLNLRNRLVGGKNSQYDEDFFRIIFRDVEEALKLGVKIKIYSMVKANGENAQVSYCEDADAWLIASKNVSLLARTKSDIKLYDKAKDGDTDRYQYAKLIAQTWFNTIDKFSKTKLSNLKKDLTNRTIIGEYCGNQDYQHLVKYERITVYWFGLVENDSLAKECVDLMTAQAFFRNYGLDTAEITDLGVYDNFRQFNIRLLRYYDEISRGRIEVHHEGAVLYFESQADPTKKGFEEKRILSLAKLKTLEYRIYRKLREKLRTFLGNDRMPPSQMISKFEKEVRDLCKVVLPPKPLEYYYKIANKALDFCFDHKKYTHLIHDHYITFISIVIYALSNNVNVSPNHFQEPFTTQLLSQPWSDFSQPKKRVITVIPVGIPGMGKSTLFTALQEYIFNGYSDVNVAIVSMDKIRYHLMNVERERNRNLTQEEVFQNTRNSTTDKYRKEIKILIDTFHRQNEFNTLFLLLDKNHPIKGLRQEIERLQDMNQQDMDVFTVVLHPKVHKPFEYEDVYLPFSLNFIVNCILRVQNRQRHETLPGNGIQSLGVMSQFLKLFQGAALESLDSDYEAYFQYVPENENSDKQLGCMVESDLASIISKTKTGESCQDKQLLEDFLDAISFNKPEQEQVNQEEIYHKAGEIIKDVLAKFSISAKEHTVDKHRHANKRHSVQFEDQVAITQTQKQQTQTTTPAAATQRQQQTHLQPNAQAPTKFPEYLGIFVDKTKNSEVFEWIQESLGDSIESRYFKGEDLFDVQQVQNTFTKYTYSELHMTTLYIGKRKIDEITEMQEYTTFQEGQTVELVLDYFVFIKDGIMTAKCLKPDNVAVENENPHITLLSNKKRQLEAKHSNDLLAQVKPPTPKNPYFSQQVVINGRSFIAFAIMPREQLVIEGVTKKHYLFR